MSTIDVDQTTVAISPDQVEPKHIRLAQGWRLSIQVFERLRRLESGRPILELHKEEDCRPSSYARVLPLVGEDGPEPGDSFLRE